MAQVLGDLDFGLDSIDFSRLFLFLMLFFFVVLYFRPAGSFVVLRGLNVFKILSV